MYEEFNQFIARVDMNSRDQEVFCNWCENFDNHRCYKYICINVMMNIMKKYKRNCCLVISDCTIDSCDNDALIRKGVWTVRVPCVRKIPEI